MDFKLLNWTNQVQQKIKNSSTLEVAFLIEVINGQNHATILYPKENDLIAKLESLNLYCQTHQVQALVFATINNNEQVFYRKIKEHDLSVF
jgi:hypothetical protein